MDSSYLWCNDIGRLVLTNGNALTVVQCTVCFSIVPKIDFPEHFSFHNIA